MKYKKLYNFYTFLCTTIWTTFLISQFIYIFGSFDNIDELTDVSYVAMTCTIDLIKMLAIYKNMDLIKSLLKKMNKPLFQPKCEEHYVLAMSVKKFHKTLFYFCLYIGLQTYIFFSAIPFLRVGLVPLTQGWFPVDFRYSPNYEIIYIFQNVVILWNTLIFLNLDTFTSGLMMQVGLQCDYLCVTLNSLHKFHEHLMFNEMQLHNIVFQSGMIFSSAYNTPWLDCDKKFQKILLNFMTQIKSPIGLKAGGLFTMSISVFVSRTAMATVKFVLTAAAILATASASPSAVDVLHDIYSGCLKDFEVSCAKPKALHWLSEVSDQQQIKLTEELMIVKKDVPGQVEERGFSNDIFEKFEDFLQSHDLLMKAPALLTDKGSEIADLVPRSFVADDIKVPLAVTGRSSKLVKKVIVPFLLGLKFKTAVLVPLALALIALKTWKALTLGLLSLVLTGALVIFKFTKPKVVNYEVIHYPQHVEHHVEHPPTSGWEHPGYGRQLTGNEMAYQAHLDS
ncbi:unnamed protein product [Phaedon cochleariae]|uniref:Odorant receptor n=1 Tax=Phaedon cochleariae TaxID=80249 RepID=A0A9N9SGH4_PHACE|nr:unnamed protein product [Phaedon cochleariae]